MERCSERDVHPQAAQCQIFGSKRERLAIFRFYNSEQYVRKIQAMAALLLMNRALFAI
jgi:hypothetical protein